MMFRFKSYSSLLYSTFRLANYLRWFQYSFLTRTNVICWYNLMRIRSLYWNKLMWYNGRYFYLFKILGCSFFVSLFQHRCTCIWFIDFDFMKIFSFNSIIKVFNIRFCEPILLCHLIINTTSHLIYIILILKIFHIMIMS